MTPWLKSLNDVASAGKGALESLIALENGDTTTAWTKLSSASKYYNTMYTYLTAEDLPNVYAKQEVRDLRRLLQRQSMRQKSVDTDFKPGRHYNFTDIICENGRSRSDRNC